MIFQILSIRSGMAYFRDTKSLSRVISSFIRYDKKFFVQVNYPKLRKNKKSEPGTPDPCNSVKCNVNHEDPFEHMKGAEGRDSPLEAEGGDTETDTEDNVSTTQLVDLILNNSVFENPHNRRQFNKILNKFLKEKSLK